MPPADAGAAPTLVPARMINEVLYCERLMYLEWVQGEFRDNVFTVDGRAKHKRVDAGSGALSEPKDGDSGDDESAAPKVSRSVWLSSERLGITAKIDLVEETSDGRVIAVEYKRGKRPRVAEGAYLPERAQLCAQVLLLREHGYVCDDAVIYFAEDRRRVTIAIDELLETTTIEAVARAKQLANQGDMPAPLVGSPKCIGCSLAGICLPDEVHHLSAESADRADTPFEPDVESDELAPRRLYPARDDRAPLYVVGHTAKIGLTKDCLKIQRRDEKTVTVRMSNTSQVAMMGNCQISTQALRTLMQRGIPITLFTGGGWYVGRATGSASKNVELRIAQYRRADDPSFCLGIAKQIVEGKIRNARTLLRRNGEPPNEVALGALKRYARKAATVQSLESLLGIEGSAARVYFQAFSSMIKADGGWQSDFARRTRRPPLDPVNALLSFAYALLTKDVALAAETVGLDPLLGFYHQPRFGRPALALDLMEEFRPLIADSVVIGAINNGVVEDSDFLRSPVGVAIHKPARRRFIEAYERRMSQLITHPIFGYRVSYRRVLEVQARLVTRLLLGEIPDYAAFRTR